MIFCTICIYLIVTSEVAIQGRSDLTAELQILQKDVSTLNTNELKNSKQLLVLKTGTGKISSQLDDLVDRADLSERRQTNITNDLDLYKARLQNTSQTQQQQKVEIDGLDKKENIIQLIIGNVTGLSTLVNSGVARLQTGLTNVNQTLKQHATDITGVKADDARRATEIQRYETAMQTRFEAEERLVAFDAEIKNHQNTAGSNTLIFDNVVLNIGNGYNVTSGVFTAPFTGVYVVKLTATSAEKALRLNLNGDFRTYGVLAVNNSVDEGFADAVVRLDVGDKLWVETISGQSDALSSAQFSGALVNTVR